MKTFLQEGAHLDYTPGSAVVSGQFLLIGTKVGVAIADIAANEQGALRITGVITGPKKTTDTPAKGAALYWDDTNKYLTTTSSGNTYAGWSFAAAISGDTTVNIKINN